MYKYLLLPALLLIACTATAQYNAVVKGRVVDSLNKTPVEFATVAILDVQDTTSSLIAYTLSDKKGNFTLHNLPAGKQLKLLISFVAYNPYRKFFTLNKAQILDLDNIKVSGRQLSEVTVRGERSPVVVRKDTIEFNTEAFKTRPNAIVEELLKKLPGIEVDHDGKISFNGQEIIKIMADGHEFFNNDYRIASKNLDAEMVDKVQIYDDSSDGTTHLTPDLRARKIINLKFKKAYKKSIFGKIYGGNGTGGRYTGAGLLNMFRDTLQISILGQGNNLNNTGFSFSDLYTSGGLNRGGSDALSRMTSFGRYGDQGIEKVLSGGININTDYGKKLKINLAYYYGHTKTDYNSVTNKQTLLNDTNFITRSVNLQSKTAINHNITSQIEWHPDNVNDITYHPTFSYTDNQSGSTGVINSSSTAIPQISHQDNISNNTGNSIQFQHLFQFLHRFKNQGETMHISQSLSISPSNQSEYSISDLTSYTSALSSFLLNRNINNVNRGADASLGINYRIPINKKISGSLDIGSDYNHQVNNTIAYDMNTATGQYDLFLQTLSSNLTRNQTKQTINPSITYSFGDDMSIAVSTNTQILQVNNRFDRNIADINQHFFNLLPGVNISIGHFSAGYQSGFTLPNIGDMIPYTVTFSPLYSVTGNPDLKPVKRNDFNFNYGNYNYQNGFNIGAGVNAEFDQNTIYRRTTINTVGVTTSTPVNMDGAHTFSMNGRLNKRFKKHNNLQFSLATNLSGSASHGFFEENGQDAYQNTYSVSFNQSFEINWKDIIDMEPSYRLNNSTTRYTGVNYNSVNYTTHAFDDHFTVSLPKKLNLEGTYTYTYNPLVSPGFQKSTNLFNLSIARELLKNDKGEVKLSCYDIFDQNISSSRYVIANTITDTQSQIIKRYFLLTLSFKFNKSLSKK